MALAPHTCQAGGGGWIAGARCFTALGSATPSLDALAQVTAIARQHARVPATDGTLDVYDPAGELADDILDAIATALGVEP